MFKVIIFNDFEPSLTNLLEIQPFLIEIFNQFCMEYEKSNCENIKKFSTHTSYDKNEN